MFRKETFKTIMERMLSRVPDDLDKREGSVIWDALAPAANELAILYQELETVVNETFADTASRPQLERIAAERGIFAYPATHAVLRFEYTGADVPVGARFNGDGVLNYVYLGDNKARCETAGTVGNSYLGDVIPIDYIQGLETARLTELLIPARDVEDTEEFRERYLDSYKQQEFGGNKQDYITKVSALDGVGGVKVYPIWNGGGTVKVVITDADYKSPTDTLIYDVQQAIDPTQNDGEGLGLAPIGHVVTVEGVKEKGVTVSTYVTMKQGWAWGDVLYRVRRTIQDYFDELARDWAEESHLVVRISQIESRLLEIDGIVDIRDTQLDWQDRNLELEPNAVPVLQEVLNGNS